MKSCSQNAEIRLNKVQTHKFDASFFSKLVKLEMKQSSSKAVLCFVLFVCCCFSLFLCVFFSFKNSSKGIVQVLSHYSVTVDPKGRSILICKV